MGMTAVTGTFDPENQRISILRTLCLGFTSHALEVTPTDCLKVYYSTILEMGKHVQ